MNNGFYETVSVGSLVAKDLLNYALSMPIKSWIKYYNFDAIQVHPNLLLQDSFLSYLAKKREFYAGILRMPPNTCYNWHTDTDRKVGLNMLLADDNKSRCVFMDDEKPGVVFAIKELKYQPSTYYVFNTQKYHMVLNTTQPRYLFSLEFMGKDTGLTFDELCLDLKG